MKDTPWTVQVRPSTDLSWLCAPIRMNNGEVDEIVVEMYFNEDEAKERAWRWAFELNLDDFGDDIAIAELTPEHRQILLAERDKKDGNFVWSVKGVALEGYVFRSREDAEKGLDIHDIWIYIECPGAPLGQVAYHKSEVEVVPQS